MSAIKLPHVMFQTFYFSSLRKSTDPRSGSPAVVIDRN